VSVKMLIKLLEPSTCTLDTVGINLQVAAFAHDIRHTVTMGSPVTSASHVGDDLALMSIS
jgi:hypothetical protein